MVTTSTRWAGPKTKALQKNRPNGGDVVDLFLRLQLLSHELSSWASF